MIRLVSFGTFRLAGTPICISTSSRCVQGLGIETVKERLAVFGDWACKVDERTNAPNRIDDATRVIGVLCIGLFWIARRCYYEHVRTPSVSERGGVCWKRLVVSLARKAQTDL